MSMSVVIDTWIDSSVNRCSSTLSQANKKQQTLYEIDDCPTLSSSIRPWTNIRYSSYRYNMDMG